MSFDETVVLRMGTDPKPKDTRIIAGHIDTQGAVMDTRSYRPQLTNFLEVQRRMHGVILQQGKAFVGRLTDMWGQTMIQLPIAGSCEMRQRRLHCPALYSDRAFSMRFNKGLLHF